MDLATKRAVVAALAPGERHTVIPGLLDFTYAENYHGAMGLFGDHAIVLVALALVVVIGLGFMLRSLITDSRLAQIGFGLMVGGAMGNIIDRVVHHFVIDFIAPRWFYIFNGADTCITVGLALMAFASLRRPAPSAVNG